MSYLLDALKKSEQTATDGPTIYVTETTKHSRFYQYLSLSLVLIIALFIGIWLGTDWQPTPLQVTKKLEPANKTVPIAPTTQQVTAPSLTNTPSSTSAKKLKSISFSDNLSDPIKNTEVLAIKPIPQSTTPIVQLQQSLQPPIATHDAQTKITDTNEVTNVNEVEGPEVQISPELLAKFEQAVRESIEVKEPDQSQEYFDSPQSDLPWFENLPGLVKRGIPTLNFSTYIYSSVPDKRWLKVNGKQLKEGQWITADLKIVEMTQQWVVIQYGQYRFRINPLG